MLKPLASCTWQLFIWASVASDRSGNVVVIDKGGGVNPADSHQWQESMGFTNKDSK